jgi:hypothetical protein
MPKTLSVTSLVLGIASVVLGFTFFIPLAAIITGAIGARREPGFRAISVTGIVLGALCMIGWLIVVVILIIVAAATAGGNLLSALAQWL